MARLCKSVAKRTNNFEEIDKELAYSIWMIEKEFNVGPITEDFPAMKFYNLIDSAHSKRYVEDQKGGSSSGTGVKTFG